MEINFSISEGETTTNYKYNNATLEQALTLLLAKDVISISVYKDIPTR